MATHTTYRRHSARFKLQLCQDIRSGARTRSAAIKEFKLSSALIQQWMVKFDRGLIDGTEDDVPRDHHYEALIAALERKVGQLTMELDLLRARSDARADDGASRTPAMRDDEGAPPGRGR